MAALLTTVVLAVMFGEYNGMLWICVGLLGFGLWIFGSLTVTVTPQMLQWHYGPGLFRWQRPLEDIESVSCEQDVAHWVWQWGIRLEPYGYLYSISGGETIRIRLKNGKQIGIRTNDSVELLSAIQGAMEARQPDSDES